MGALYSIATYPFKIINSNVSLQKYTGIRVSEPGFEPSFPTKDMIENYARSHASIFEDSTPAVIFTIGHYWSDGGNGQPVCHLSFPGQSDDTSISFQNTDKYDDYLSYFDQVGIKVFLQIEAGNADVNTLINLILSHYGHHSSVVGFGVDVEWYEYGEENDNIGEAVTDTKAQEWENLVKSYNSQYKLFLKHWLIEKMPQNYRGNIIFVNDGQQHQSLSDMISFFRPWIDLYSSTNDVYFQYGYESDQSWWSNYENPALEIGNAIRSINDNAGLFWVDFTIDELSN